MGVVMKTKSVFLLTGRFINEAVSFVVFLLLDFLDFVLCFIYRIIDFIVEAEVKHCYCSSSKEVITRSGMILNISEMAESKIVRVTSSKLHLEEISETLYTRPTLISKVSKFINVNEIKKVKVERDGIVEKQQIIKSCKTVSRVGTKRPKFTVNSEILEMFQGKLRREQTRPVHRWSDCDCGFCAKWTFSNKDTLFVRSQGPKDQRSGAKEDVLFIHGFISSSSFWSKTVFPNFSNYVKSNYRLFACDLLGFGQSPKPADSMYTLREHLDMIERSVLEPNKVKSFHIVAHSLGCILALALAVKHPGAVKSLSLLAPPYFPVPKGEHAAQYVMNQVAPRRVWPPFAFGGSICCYYEHITRTVCLIVSRNHRFWEFILQTATGNRIPPFLLEGFFCHTHNAAWHTLHNVICGSAKKMEGYMNTVRDLKCDVNVIHGSRDDLIPVKCSYNVKTKIPHTRVNIIDKKDHITVVVGREKAFARELEEIWRNASCDDQKAGC